MSEPRDPKYVDDLTSHMDDRGASVDVPRPVGRHFAPRVDGPAIDDVMADAHEVDKDGGAASAEHETPSEKPTAATAQPVATSNGSSFNRLDSKDSAPSTHSESDAVQGEGALSRADLAREESAPRDDDAAPVDDPSAAAAPSTRPKRRGRLVLRVLAIVLCLLLMGGAAVALFINHSIAAGERAFKESMQKAVADSESTVEYNGGLYRLNENMVTIAFIGFDDNTTNYKTGQQTTGQSDTVMVFALNTDTGEATCIVIPRDSMVAVDTYIDGSYSGQSIMQLCLQYTYGSSNEESSELVAQCASRVLMNMPIDYYFTLNIEGVGPLTDAIGGVTLVPTQTVDRAGVVEGRETTLTGDAAMYYVRTRSLDSVTASLDRQQRQVSFLKAFVDKVLTGAKSDPGMLMSLYQTALDYTWTNLGFDEFSYLSSVMLSKGMTSLKIVSLDGEATGGEKHIEFNLDQDSVRDVVMNTFYTPVDEEDTAN